MSSLTPSNLRHRYLAVLTVVGLISVGGFALLESLILSQETAAREINLAGRQRMLSQRIAFLKSHLGHAHSKKEKSRTVKDLSDSLDLLEKTHAALSKGDVERGLRPPQSDALRELYFGSPGSLDTQVRAFLEDARLHLSEAELGTPTHIHQLRYPDEDLNQLLRLLDRVVTQYEMENRASVSTLERGQILLLFMTLLVLVASGVLVFDPMVSQIHATLSQLRQNESSLRRERQLLNVTTENMDQALSVFDGDLNLVVVNHKFSSLLGLPAELSRVGTRFEDIMRYNAERGDYGPGDVEELVRERVELAKNTVPHQFERTRPDGTSLLITGNPMPGGGFVTTYADITERKKQERIIANSESRFRQYIRNMHEGYWRIDAEGKTVDINPAMSNFLGRSHEDALGKTIFDFVDEENAEIFRQELAKRKDGETGAYQITLTRPDGSQITGLNHATPIYDDDGERAGSIGLWTDMTAQLEAERHLLLAKEEAELANRTKSEFLASMSHELRTPLAGVVGFADMLLEDKLPEDSREKVIWMKESMDILLELLNEILDLSKLEAGKMELEEVDFHLPSLIDASTGLFERKLNDGKLTLTTVLSDDFPEAVNSDPTRIRQILLNLIGNAVKFTEIGGITVEGSLIKSETGEDFIHIAVHDSGIGMKPEAINTLFDDFTQADSSISRKYQGTGLGLSICRRLVELMNGEIGAKSQYRKGSTFWFTVPYKAATASVSKVTKDVNSKMARYRARRPLHVLVVDDNDVNLRIITATAQSFGHGTETAKDGMQAIERHEAGDFDLILMDVRMPVLSGPDATALIRDMEGKKAAIPIIALTADAMESHKREYLAAGMDAVVDKPIDRKKLALTINTVMQEEIHVPVAGTADDEAPPPPDEGGPDEEASTDPDVDGLLRKMQEMAARLDGSPS